MSQASQDIQSDIGKGEQKARELLQALGDAERKLSKALDAGSYDEAKSEVDCLARELTLTRNRIEANRLRLREQNKTDQLESLEKMRERYFQIRAEQAAAERLAAEAFKYYWPSVQQIYNLDDTLRALAKQAGQFAQQNGIEDFYIEEGYQGDERLTDASSKGVTFPDFLREWNSKIQGVE